MWALLLSSFDCDFDSSGFNCDLGYKFRESKQEILHLRIFWINGEREGVQSVEMQGKESSSLRRNAESQRESRKSTFSFLFFNFFSSLSNALSGWSWSSKKFPFLFV